MTLEDCQAYAAFLAAPWPAERWCGPRGREKWSPLGRPFEGPLSSRAQAQAITILKNLYSFLADQNYLTGNPWKGVARPPTNAPDVGLVLIAAAVLLRNNGNLLRASSPGWKTRRPTGVWPLRYTCFTEPASG